MRAPLTLFTGLRGKLFYLLVRGAGWCFRHLHRESALRLCRLLAWPFLGSTRERRHANLELYFQPRNWSAARGAEFEARFAEYVAHGGVDYLRLEAATAADLGRTVRLCGEEHLRQALARGRGAVIVAGHFGTGWYIPPWLAARGYRVTTIFGTTPRPAVRKHLWARARRHGYGVTFVNDGAYRDAGRALRANEVIFLLFDYEAPADRSLWLPFGMARLRLHLGPAVLAVRQRAAVLYASAIYDDQWQPRVSFQPAPARPGGSPRTQAVELTRWLGTRLLQDVEARPAQWFRWNRATLEPCMPENAGNRRVAGT